MKLDYPEDCERIVKIVFRERARIISPIEAQAIWEYVSGERCAQWLSLNCMSEKEIADNVVRILEE